MRVAVDFPRPAGGFFSHFAHFVCDFVLPFFSLFVDDRLIGQTGRNPGLVLELKDAVTTRFGPLLPLVGEIFPEIKLDYVSRFTIAPIRPRRLAWENSPQHVEHFLEYLRRVLPLKPANFGVVIVRRGSDRAKYPGGNFFLKSGADRRCVGVGFEKLVQRVLERRPDTICAELEQLSFAEQVSLFLNADTLIGQHGAAFVHAHWMPKFGHLIELQCRGYHLSPNMVPRIARLRGHRVSVVDYPCKMDAGCVAMSIGDATKVARLVRPKPLRGSYT